MTLFLGRNIQYFSPLEMTAGNHHYIHGMDYSDVKKDISHVV